jgi:hypothetical protein
MSLTTTCTLYDKRDDFDLAIVNFSSLSSNIPLSPSNGVYISHLVQYARACFAYETFSERGKLLTKLLLMQGYNESRLKSANSTVAIMTLFAITIYHWPYAE